MHRVAVVVADRSAALDVAIPAQVFGTARALEKAPGELWGDRLYDVIVCGERPGATMSGPGGLDLFTMTAPYTYEDARTADTIIVPGGDNVSCPSAELVELLRDAHARGVRIASICGGALVLAAAELLDGKIAATHWTTADALGERFPEVQVDASVLFADCGNVLTSAGAATGFDLCMHMVRKDFGAAVAAEAARHIVLPPQRDGGQAQFIVHPEPGPDCGSLEPTMRWIRENLAEPITLAGMAAYATVSPRTLNRKFREQTGTTPLQWLLRQRIQHAQELLETTTIPIEEIAQHCGFGTAINMRQHFTRQVRTSPIGYRRAFQSIGRSSSA
ncbi:helix-turn-helix domain-containing protein [Kribbella antibiotica]|uniref:Helix-turn-helix domain-containing protein n=1 Tax=Kribbella antibiotica TaxID=190195 RepID=A0A4R4ZH32_9ACTN|nr:helix-turn-helix domain-containing protein [Kribbella antibiotica]TDD57938.1 helix-turn-helix domain-containing protein [Kribbella antibiotica]